MRRFLAVLCLSSCSLFFRGLTVGDSCEDSFVSFCEEAGDHQQFTSCQEGIVFTIDCPIGSECNLDEGCVSRCGDAVVSPNEECDIAAEDQPPCTLFCQRISICGDGNTDFPETCDDRNLSPGDGCDELCQIEPTPEVEPNDDFILLNKQPTITTDAVIIGDQASFVDHDFFPVQNLSNDNLLLRVDLYSPTAGLRRPCSSFQASFGDSQSRGLTALSAQGQVIQQFEPRGGDVGPDRCPGGEITIDAGATIYLLVATNTVYLLELDFDGQVVCGDGDIGIGEGCEPPGTPSCDAFCRLLPLCGDGLIFISQEECDDGNVTSGDGCDELCQFEFTPGCGDGAVDPGEECDDGNTLNGDGCNQSCRLEAQGFDEVEPNEDGTPSIGGGVDGNDFSVANANELALGTLLSAQISPAGDEDVFSISNPTANPVQLRVDTFSLALGVGVPCTGFGLTDTILFLRNNLGAELAQNDDRAGTDDLCSGLSFTIQPQETVFVHIIDFQDNSEIDGYLLLATDAPLSCGDGLRLNDEECDDGNLVDGDGCDSTCKIEGLINEIEPNNFPEDAQGPFSDDVLIRGQGQSADFFRVQNVTAAPRTVALSFVTVLPGLTPCQSAQLFIPEAVDDTTGLPVNIVETQIGGCPGAFFSIEPGQSIDFSLFPSLPEYLMKIDFTECGNGVIELDEECEPSGSSTCDTQCQRVPVCGDAFVDAPEICDDANTNSGDGCSASCQLELNFALEQEPNDDTRPTITTGLFDFDGNDFSEENAQGGPAGSPFPGAIELVGSLNPGGDEDIFSIQNPNNFPVSMRLDTFHPALGAQSCGGAIDTALVIRDELGLFIAGNQDRINQEGPDFNAQPGDDLCAGLRVDLAPQQTIYAQVFSGADVSRIFGYLFVVQIETPICGDGIVTLPEPCDGGADCDANCQFVGLTQELEPNDDGSPEPQLPRDFFTILDGNDFSAANAQGVSPAGGPFVSDVMIQGALHPAGDEDVFAVQNIAGSPVNVTLELFYPQTGLNNFCFGAFLTDLSISTSVEAADPVLTMRDSAGNPLAQENDRNENDVCPTMTFLLAPGQTAFAHLTDRADHFELSSYLLRISFSICGDGNISAGEECEPPGTASCDSDCQRVPICSDGNLDLPETCDDGNLINGDGCDSLCQSEGFACEIGQSLLLASATDLPQIIPATPFSQATSTINIASVGVVQRVGVSIADIDHSFLGELEIALISPGGTQVLLFDHRGFNGDNIIGASFADSCISVDGPISGGVAPFTGCFAPESSLSALNNQTANGAWRLQIRDGIPGEGGALNAWGLALCVETAATCGNGQLQAGEECEPPNTATCDSACQRVQICGDGFIDDAEECDDSNANNNDGCSSSCLLEFCGDGVVQANEQCEDGNNQDNDGCDNDCIHRADLVEDEPNEDGAINSGQDGIDGNDFSSVNVNGPFSTDLTILGALSPAGDEDVFAITNPSATPIEVRLDLFSEDLGLGVPCAGFIDTGLNIRDNTGALLAQNDDRLPAGQDRCSGLSFTLLPNQTVFAQVVEFRDDELISGYFLVVDF